jgi:hypothetical protein
MSGKSEDWKYFEKVDSDHAKCKKCLKPIGCKGSSTSSLSKHLKQKHGIEITKQSRPEEPSSSVSAAKKPKTSPAEQPSLFTFVQRESLCEIVSKLIALDGFTAHGVANSSFIRESLNSRGFHLPKVSSSVMKLVHQFYENTVKKQITEEIDKLKENKFSATLDEWTSLRNVNVHSTNGIFFNLGLIRIKQSCPAETIEELMLNKLEEFGLTFADIVAATTDGAPVMTKFGRLICKTSIHQLCFNHALHLAVLDVLFRRKTVLVSENSYEDDSDDDGDDEEDDDNNEGDSQDDSTGESCAYEIRADINDILKMVRKIVVFFKRSPVKNSILQKYIKENHGRELTLILDCRTRWNSTEQMVERFLLVFNSIVLALRDLNSSELIIDDNDIAMLQNLIKCLQPVKVASEELGRREANLLTAETTINFLLETLEQQTDTIGQALYEMMKVRIYERRNKDLVSLISFLQNKNSVDDR